MELCIFSEKRLYFRASDSQLGQPVEEFRSVEEGKEI
jgi:hypothetical protein